MLKSNNKIKRVISVKKAKGKVMNKKVIATITYPMRISMMAPTEGKVGSMKDQLPHEPKRRRELISNSSRHLRRS